MTASIRVAPALLASSPILGPCLGLLLLAPALAPAAEPGTYWEQTMEMEMGGFAMPATTMKVCLPKKQDWEKPPAAQKDQRCKMTEVKRSGSTMKWKMACEGQEAMEGQGEMTWTSDTFDTKTVMRTSHGVMNVKGKGRKLGGDCDPEELKREAEKKGQEARATSERYQAEGKAAVAKTCDGWVDAMYLPAFTGAGTMCKEPEQKARFCARLKTSAGMERLGGPSGTPEDAARFCGVDLAALRVDLCREAQRANHLSFIGKNCPAETKVIAQRECAGRSYTDLGAKYRDFCTTYAADLVLQDEKAAKKKKPETPGVEEGKKLLKGMLGF